MLKQPSPRPVIKKDEVAVFDAESGAAGSAASGSMTRREILIAVAFFVVICYITHFLHWRSYGLYEDDFHFGAPAMTQTWSELGNSVAVYFTKWPQGRPIGWTLISALPFLSYRLSGFQFFWAVEFSILTLSAILCYIVLRSRLPSRYAAVGAVFFCAYPADTTQLFLHGVAIRVAVAAFLGACIAYRSNRWVLCYVLAACTFLTYETLFMPFFGLPLLYPAQRRIFWKQLTRHAAMLISIIIVVIPIRMFQGEERVRELDGHIFDTIRKILTSLWVGPLACLKSAGMRTATVVQRMDHGLMTVLLVSAFLILLAWYFLPDDEKPSSVRPFVQIASVCALGVLFLELGYGLVFRDPYFPPTEITGRTSAAHIAGAFGGSMLAGGLSWLISLVSKSYGMRTLAFIGLSLYLGSMIAYHDIVQREFAYAWEVERTFWSEVMRACPDLQEGTVIIHEQQYNYFDSVLANAWSDAIILPELLRFPSSWREPPRVYSVPPWMLIGEGLPPTWRDGVREDKDGLKWFVPTTDLPAHWERLVPANLIVLEQTGPGHVSRVTGIRFAGKDYELKSPRVSYTFEKTPLYTHLIR